jgi:hypothetical protein
MAVKLNGASDSTIMCVGPWTSLTYLTYIHSQIGSLTAGLAVKMSQRSRSRMSDKSFNGWLYCWPERGFAHGTTAGQHKASQAAPDTALQISLDAQVVATCIFFAPKASLARQTVTATRQLVCLVATTVGRHRCWGAHCISFGFDTHHPDPLLQVMGWC